MKSWQIPTEDQEMTQSTARSGSMFYMTPDKKYLFKTILHPEVEVMMTILKPYFEHLSTNPKTFIVKIYGLFRISYGSNKTWVLIMGNTLPPGITIQEKYDLKGRKAKPGKSVDERGIISQAIYKDNEITRTLRLDEDQKARYIEQLEKDVAMLSKYDIMDYSLLVGIHKVTDEERSNSKRGHQRRVKSNQRTRSEKTRTGSVLVGTGDELDRGRSKDRLEKKEKYKVTSRDKEKNQDLVETVEGLSKGKKGKLDEKDDAIAEMDKKYARKSEERLKSKSKIEEKLEDNEKKSARKSEERMRSKVKIEDLREDKEKEKDKDKEGDPSSRKTSRKNSEERKKQTSRKQSEEREKKISRNPSEEKIKKISRKNSEKLVQPRSNPEEKKPLEDDNILNNNSSSNISKSKLPEADPSPKKAITDRHKKISSRTRLNSEVIAKTRRNDQDDEETKSKKKKSRKEQEATDEKDIYSAGGFRGVNPETQEEEIIFFGIIDNLTNYNINKKMANFFKNALWDDETLSTVPASFYASRFMAYMTKDLLGEAENEQLLPLKGSLDLNKIDKASLSPRPATERPKGSAYVVERRPRSGSGSIEDMREARLENLRESGRSEPPPVKQEILQQLDGKSEPARKGKKRTNPKHTRADSAGGRLTKQEVVSPRDNSPDEEN
uniref:PIPK domain-containing protein n=1 Tax=Arcella intermedia TaxID=1963864 RepID=A0A6B2KYU3_9EUKA